MSESENTDAIEQEPKNTRKRVRHRKKQLYENILKQMEFYFSDANLSKDRFLGELVKNDPFVPIAEFLKFNKIRSLTQNIIDIVKAMKHSTTLELSEDKLKVKRKTAMQPYDADARTVYVESIPISASRDWLERVFSEYGHVAYISLPKFKNSQKNKGYGFIEFEKPQDAQKCINAFTKMGSKLPICMPPEELSSIKMFSVEELVEPEEAQEPKEEYEPPKKKTKKGKEKKLQKLELKVSNDSDCEKRVDTPTPTDENKSITTPTEEGKTTDMESKDELTSQDEGKNSEGTPRKKKIKKRSAKEKGKSKSNLDKDEAPKGALWGLQVLPKCEWKALRNKYLNLQRKFMKEVKANLHSKRRAYSSIPAPAAPSVEAEPVSASKGIENTKNVAPLQRIPGVFVTEILPEPCLDVRLTKRTIKSNIHVLHVEAKEGQKEVIIRFDSAQSASDYASNSTSGRVLCGAEDEAQWARAEAARARPRGLARLRARHHLAAPPRLAPASPQPTHTHIRFDDE